MTAPGSPESLRGSSSSSDGLVKARRCGCVVRCTRRVHQEGVPRSDAWRRKNQPREREGQREKEGERDASCMPASFAQTSGTFLSAPLKLGDHAAASLYIRPFSSWTNRGVTLCFAGGNNSELPATRESVFKRFHVEFGWVRESRARLASLLVGTRQAARARRRIENGACTSS